MEGVLILNQFEVATKTVFSWHNFWMGVIFGAVIGLIIGVCFGLSEHDWLAFSVSFAVFSVLLGALFGILGGSALPDAVDYETHYEVTITEEVNMQEFMDKYEIVETRGAIYTVREK